MEKIKVLLGCLCFSVGCTSAGLCGMYETTKLYAVPELDFLGIWDIHLTITNNSSHSLIYFYTNKQSNGQFIEYPTKIRPGHEKWDYFMCQTTGNTLEVRSENKKGDFVWTAIIVKEVEGTFKLYRFDTEHNGYHHLPYWDIKQWKRDEIAITDFDGFNFFANISFN